jgi:integrase
MTDKPSQSIKRLRERCKESDAISDADGKALLDMSDRIRLLGASAYSDWSHEKYLMRLVVLAEEVGGLADALEDQDAAERLVAHVNAEKADSPETNKDYRVSLRQFGKLATDGDEIVDTLSWIPGGYPDNYDPAPNPAKMLRWEHDIKPMLDACHNFRDKALIAIAWDLGPRPHELFDMTRGSFEDHDYGLQVTVDGKRGRRSAVLVPSVPYVNQWLSVHPGDEHDDPLWSRLNRPEQVSNNYIRSLLKDRARDAGVERPVTPSNFRKSSASHLASQGVSQAHLEDHHGWSRGSDIAARYISVFQEANDREIARAHGVEVTEDEPDDIAPVACPRCDKETPHDEPACVWCGQALSHTATEVVEEQRETAMGDQRRVPEDVATAIQRIERFLGDDAALRTQIDD